MHRLYNTKIKTRTTKFYYTSKSYKHKQRQRISLFSLINSTVDRSFQKQHSQMQALISQQMLY